MKKLAIAITALALAATPVFACPGHESQQDQDQAPRTAENQKKNEAKPAEKAKPAPKADTAKKAEPKKDAKAKPAEKVSRK